MTEGASLKFFDEMHGGDGRPRDAYEAYCQWFDSEDIARLKKKSLEAEAFFRRTGITFNVYGQQEAAERLIPFDIVPRIISAAEWRRLERGHRATCQGDQRLLARYLPPTGNPAGRACSRGTDCQQ